jgi:hypothetical protein
MSLAVNTSPYNELYVLLDRLDQDCPNPQTTISYSDKEALSLTKMLLECASMENHGDLTTLQNLAAQAWSNSAILRVHRNGGKWPWSGRSLTIELINAQRRDSRNPCQKVDDFFLSCMRNICSNPEKYANLDYLKSEASKCIQASSAEEDASGAIEAFSTLAIMEPERICAS